jgi:hypothetical protein
LPNLQEKDTDKDTGKAKETGTETKPSLPAKCPLQLRVDKLWRKRESTPWGASELRAWQTAKAIVAETTDEEWALLEKWFSLPSSQAEYRKTDPAALLNNWHAELQKAQRKMQDAKQSKFSTAF